MVDGVKGSQDGEIVYAHNDDGEGWRRRRRRGD
jgi:dipeptidase